MSQNGGVNDVDFLDLLKNRVEAGKSILIIGPQGAGVTQDVEALRQKLASETSKPARVIEVIDLPEIPVTRASPRLPIFSSL
jgi:type IV secretory pathway ATPase VirB11/archaellum biosynthesis ATPase